jgi:hypothetical protein
MSSDHIDQPCVTIQSVVCHNFSLFAAKILGVSAKNKQTAKYILAAILQTSMIPLHELTDETTYSGINEHNSEEIFYI